METYDPRFFERIASLEREHFWFVARRRIVAAAVAAAVSRSSRMDRILELGCGTGGMLRLLKDLCPRATVIGADLFFDALAFSRQRRTGSLVQADLARQPFRAGFDLVCLFDVLEHMPDDDGQLRLLSSLVAPGGFLLLTVPAWPSLWSYFDAAARHRRRYTPADLRSKLERVGFVEPYVTPFFGLLHPVTYLVRVLLGGARSRESTPADDHDLALGDLREPGLLNRPLRLLLTLEAPFVRRLMRLPLGTSLLALARAPEAPASGPTPGSVRQDRLG